MLWRAYRSLFRWVVAQTYRRGPSTWRTATVGACLVVVAAMLLHQPAIALVGLGVAVPAGYAWRTWRRLTAYRGRPKIIVARFASESAAYDDLAGIHVRELERRLRANPLMAEHAEIVTTAAPLSRSEAARVMRHAPAVGLVSGSALAVAGSVRWDGWLRVMWVSTVGRFKANQQVLDAQWHFTLENSKLPIDAEVPATALTAEVFDASHARAAEVALTLAVADVRNLMPAALAHFRAHDYGSELPPGIAVRLAIARAKELAAEDSPAKAGEWLRTEISQYDVAIGWEFVQSMFLQAWSIADLALQHQREALEASIVDAAKRAIAIDPSLPMSHSNLGFHALNAGDFAAARRHLLDAIGLSRPREPGSLYPDLVVHLFRAGGEAADWTRWQQTFSRVAAEDKHGVLDALEITHDETVQAFPPANFADGR